MKLSPTQLKSLQYMAATGTIKYTKIPSKRIYRFAGVRTDTMQALERRGLVVIYRPYGVWASAWITNEGREALKGAK